MGLLDLLIPFMIPVKGVVWIGEKIREVSENELFDKSKVNEKLLELQMRYEMGQIGEEEFEKKEAELLENIETIRRYEEEKEG